MTVDSVTSFHRIYSTVDGRRLIAVVNTLRALVLGGVHSTVASRANVLATNLFCKSSLPQPFLFLFQDSLYGFSRLFTVTSEHIRLFTFFLFLHFFSCRFRAVD